MLLLAELPVSPDDQERLMMAYSAFLDPYEHDCTVRHLQITIMWCKLTLSVTPRILRVHCQGQDAMTLEVHNMSLSQVISCTFDRSRESPFVPAVGPVYAASGRYVKGPCPAQTKAQHA